MKVYIDPGTLIIDAKKIAKNFKIKKQYIYWKILIYFCQKKQKIKTNKLK